MADPANPKKSKVVVVLTAIDSSRWFPPHSVPGSGSLFVMGNAIFLRNQKSDGNDVDVLHTHFIGNDDGTIENLDDSG